MSLPIETDYISADDFVLITQGDCIRRVSYEEFIKNISLGGFSICQAVMNCWQSMGDFSEDIETDTPPVFSDLYIQVGNRMQDRFFTNDEFASKYYDAEGDKMARVEIVGGNLEGISWNGAPVFVGQVIGVDNLHLLEYDAKDVDEAYQQYIEIEVYDENNIKAV